MSDPTYCVNLSPDEFMWVTETLDDARIHIDDQLTYAHGDDREHYLKLLPIATRVCEEFDQPTKFVPPPKREAPEV